MPDNVKITHQANSTPPDGTIIATDIVGTAHYQRFKLDIGGDGASVPVTDLALPATTPTVYNKTLTSVDTEYSQALTANTREFRFRCRTLYDVRYSFSTGKVAVPTAPWLTLPAGSDYWCDGVNLPATTIYFATDQAGVIMEIEEWR